jgi:Rrf2 family transcriptional regulator, iron-sulfur cluster assembly transcription factor
MQLSTKGRYAVMAMVDLAKRGGPGSALPLTEIAQSQQLPISYLEQLFMKLRRSGLVTAVRGPHGGYCLARPAGEISIAEIMMAADESVRMTRCSDEGTELCLGTKRCETHELWQALGDHIGAFLSIISLQHVMDGTFGTALMAARVALKPAKAAAAKSGMTKRPEKVAAS